MLSLPSATAIFLCREPVDFRKAHDGLTAIIRDELGEDIFAGGAFVFLNKRRDRIKLIAWDRNGLWMHYKRLEKGTFKWVSAGTSNKVALTRAELSMLLEGIDLKAGKFRPHFLGELRIERREGERQEGGSSARHRRTGRAH